MRVGGLKARAAKKLRTKTDSAHSLPVAPDTLNQGLATALGQKWVGDITYIWTDEG